MMMSRNELGRYRYKKELCSFLNQYRSELKKNSIHCLAFDLSLFSPYAFSGFQSFGLTFSDFFIPENRLEKSFLKRFEEP